MKPKIMLCSFSDILCIILDISFCFGSLFESVSLGPFKDIDHTSESGSSFFKFLHSLRELLKLESLNHWIDVVSVAEFKHFLGKSSRFRLYLGFLVTSDSWTSYPNLVEDDVVMVNVHFVLNIRGSNLNVGSSWIGESLIGLCFHIS